jgi:tetratricopeptide (TPR) repeat protein
VILLIALAIAPSLAAEPAAADAAFDAGDHARALALYDEVLAGDPGNVHALLRSGMLLSWDRKFEEALARYERALAREPGNARVLLERGKVLLWSSRYDEAVEAFARVLRVQPDEPWALCGTAQAYAWRGRHAEARPYYERALAADPDMKEARLGLAYVDLAEGDTSAALAAADALEVAHPGDPEVAELRRAVSRARAAWIQVGYDHADDSDENRMNTYLVEGGFGLPARLDLRLGYAHHDLHGPVPLNADADGTVDRAYAVVGWQPRPKHRAEFRLGAARSEDSDGVQRTAAIGGVTYTFPIGEWTGRASLGRDPFLYSPQILDNEIDVTTAAFSAAGPAARRIWIEADAGYGDFSDGNTRLSANAGAWYVWTWPARRLLAGGVVRYLTFSDDLDNGYFDPSDLIAGLASLRSNGRIGRSAWDHEVSGEAGVQRYTFDGEENSGKPLWNLYGLVARPLPRGLTLQLFAGWGNSSTASGPGFNSVTYGARLRWTIGG